MGKEFEKEPKGNKPIIAICYDFDKTLSPTDMQAQGLIQDYSKKETQISVNKFWKQSNSLATDNEMDQNLAWMYSITKMVYGQSYLKKKLLEEYGSRVELFSGVETWFDRINKIGEQNNIEIEHYIISSGLKEMIEGTKIKEKFKRIYASSYYYDDNGVAVWPAQVINYTNKTQFLYRIEKGYLDVNDFRVNDKVSEEEIRIPFRNFIYIGDSDTDVPCMKLVNLNQGHSIGVYNPNSSFMTNKDKVHQMIREDRIKYFVPADYSEGSEIERLIEKIIKYVACNETLQTEHDKCKKEGNKAYTQKCEANVKCDEKNELILKLAQSSSFKETHTIIAALNKISDWTLDEANSLFEIAIENTQVRYILEDEDILNFYKELWMRYNSELTNNFVILDFVEKNNLINRF